MTPSGVFRVDASDAARMGMFPVCAVYGGLESMDLDIIVDNWNPMSIAETLAASPVDAVSLPFKIGGLVLPMLNHNATYDDAVRALCSVIERHYEDHSSSDGFYPIVSCGETCDALGYGSDILDVLIEGDKRKGFYFNHKSGENNKCCDNYADSDLFARIAYAHKVGLRPLIIAVGGGVNGNSIGLIAAMTGADFIEVPTTPMHFNDATTSAKKAFSLVKDGVILSKNILGAFYLPLLVFCVSEMILTISSANAHATVGEATKTMNMLGVANSPVGAADYFNILGASEFASDFTKILTKVDGFEKFVTYITSSRTKDRLKCVKMTGKKINQLRKEVAADNAWELERRRNTSRSRAASNSTLTALTEGAPVSIFDSGALSTSTSSGPSLPETNRAGAVDRSNMNEGEGVTASFKRGGIRTSLSFSGLSSALSSASSLDDLARSREGSTASEDDLIGFTTRSRSNSRVSESDDDYTSTGIDIDFSGNDASDRLNKIVAHRRLLMREFRKSYYDETPEQDKEAIKDFLTTINFEIVKAKAMFLAYSDPFEKYRALLFEYAHTLGHGIEAFANALYARAEKKGIYVPSSAQRLHGQCVGMAVLWAGEMSKELGVLEGQGLELHQSFVYLFNRHGGFTFAPLRKLCEKLNVDVEELVEGVLKVVRRDNKRGYCNCSSATASVDQLVVQRPGRMLRSRDPNAELRYLVEVDESLQASVIRRAWHGEFDLVADLHSSGTSKPGISFVPFDLETYTSSQRKEETSDRSSLTRAGYDASSSVVSNYIHKEVALMYTNPQEWPEEKLYQCQPCATND
jgi:3-dehydroquinate synthetase